MEPLEDKYFYVVNQYERLMKQEPTTVLKSSLHALQKEITHLLAQINLTSKTSLEKQQINRLQEMSTDLTTCAKEVANLSAKLFPISSELPLDLDTVAILLKSAEILNDLIELKG